MPGLKTRAGLLAGVVLLGVWSVAAAETKTAEAADKKAYASAMSNPDAQKRLEALRAFVKQYPKSSRVGRAQELVLETLAKHFPDRGEEIERQVKVVLKKARGLDGAHSYVNVAQTLGENNVELPLAEKLVLKAQKSLNPNAFDKWIRKMYADSKVPEPSQAEIDDYFKHSRSIFSGVLGMVYFKEGKSDEARASLRQAYTDNPDNAMASGYLGMMAAKEGRKDEALTYLTRARLTGKPTAEQEKELEGLYQGSAKTGSTSLEDYLDARYAVLFPQPFAVTKYAGKTTGRMALVELFTGSGCPPCVGADLALDGDMERYSRKELAVLVYDQHIPEPDPLTNPAGVARFDFYNGGGTPTLVVDGKVDKPDGAGRKGSKVRYEKNNKLIDAAVQTTPEAKIELTAKREADTIHVHATTADVKSTSKDLRLRIALVENRIRYSGENGIRFHEMVVRGMASEGGFPTEAGKAGSFDHTFDVSEISSELKTYLEGYEKSNSRFGPIAFVQKTYQINPADVSVVAFVQDMSTKHVLQAAYVNLASAQ